MGKTKLQQYFKAKQAQGHNLFVPFITAGDGPGGYENLPDRIALLEKSGAAAVELGIPFSDPVADGPTIQAANLRALKNGTTLASVLEILTQTKKQRKIPIIIMTYYNPVFRYGITNFAKDCQVAGVNGVIIPDIPLEEEAAILAPLQKQQLAFIRLTALTSTKERQRKIAQRSEGFLYAMAVTGTTGARKTHTDQLLNYLTHLKNISPVPVLAGFGIATSEQAQSIATHCDGVIVGSKIVDLLHEEKYDEITLLIENSL